MKDTQVILEIIKELRADASLNYKKEVLARYSFWEPFKEFLIRVYNPRINYFMRKIPDVSKYETEPPQRARYVWIKRYTKCSFWEISNR